MTTELLRPFAGPKVLILWPFRGDAIESLPGIPASTHTMSRDPQTVGKAEHSARPFFLHQ